MTTAMQVQTLAPLFLHNVMYMYVQTHGCEEDIEQDNSKKGANVEDSTEDKHQDIPQLVVVFLSTPNPMVNK